MAGIVADWKKQYYAQVPAHGLTHDSLSDAASVFMRFLELPEDKKLAIQRTMTGEADKKRIVTGYMRRSAVEDPDGEEKMYFHYHPEIETEFVAAIAVAGEPAQHFFTRARIIWDNALKTATDAINEFEVEWPGIRERFLPQDRSPRLVIRFLAYHKTQPGEFLAKAHYDRGTFTIALGESAPGLRIGNPLTEVDHKSGYGIIFPATGFENDIDSAIKPAWHDVVQRPDAQLSADTARWAIVAFFDLADGTYVPIERTHTL